MTTCDICGKEAIGNARVEGALVSVCRSCMRYGKPVNDSKRSVVLKTQSEAKLHEFKTISGFGGKIKQARQKLSLTLEELGKKLSLSHSMLLDLEAEKFKPSIEVAKRLEAFLKIKIIEEEKSDSKDAPLQKSAPSSSREFTLADLVEIKRKK